MLPGCVAGHYEFDEAHVDLRPLSQFANARLFNDEALAIDTANQRVICANRPSVGYDVLSVNIGSRPDITSVAGAGEFTTPVKPINRVYRPLATTGRPCAGSTRVLTAIGVVGAGAGGVEMVLTVQYRLRQLLMDRGRGGEELELHLISEAERIVPAFDPGVAERFERVLQARGVRVYRGAPAAQVSEGQLTLADGQRITLDEILWVTAASAPGWLSESGLDVDDQGLSRFTLLCNRRHTQIFSRPATSLTFSNIPVQKRV